MKRIGMLAMAVVALSTASAFAQVTTLPELHSFFGAPSLVPFPAGPVPRTPGDATSNPGITVSPGTTVYLPLYTRVLQGNNTAPTQIQGLRFELWGLGAGGFLGSNASATAQLMDRSEYSEEVNGIAPGSTGLTGGFGLMGRTGLVFIPGQPLMNSAGNAPAPDSGDAYYIGAIAINVGAGAPLNSRVDLFLSTLGVAGAVSVLPGQQSNWAMGANAIGDPDLLRRGTTTVAVAGAGPSNVSSLADASITVVPEPGTLGLLALGLLGLRRRRAC